MDLLNTSLEEILHGKGNGLNPILDVIMHETKSTYGLIAEKTKEGYLRFHAIRGIDKESPYMHRFQEHGYIDFSQPNTLHNRVLITADPFVCNDIPVYRKGCPFNKDHPYIQAYCSVAIKNYDNEVIGVIALGRNDPYDEKSILGYLKEYNATLANLLTMYRMIQDLKTDTITFVANTGNELRNPLDGIINVTRILEESQLNANQRDSISIISRCSLQMLDTVNDIIDYSQIMSGRLKLDLQPCSIKMCLDDIYQIMKERARDKGLTVSIEIDPIIPDLLLEDTVRITQILANVIGNAIKFTKKGQVKIIVKKHNNDIIYTVSDTGMGIAPEKLKDIFNPHHQTKLGLGLAITNALVALRKGTINITSQVNKGTTIEITLPIHKYDDIVDMDRLKIFYEKYPILIIDSNVSERTQIFNIVGKVSDTPIMTNNIADASIYLSHNTVFGYKMIIANANNFDFDDFNTLNIPIDIIVLLIADEYTLEKVSIRYNHHILHLETEQLLLALNANYVLNQTSTPISTSPIGNTKILLAAEDKTIIALLKSLGHTDIDLAYDGLDVFVKVTTGNYDICFIDLKLPIIDGITATKKIRESAKLTAIVALTISMSETIRDECFKAGMNGYITKPINKTELEKIMNTIVMKKIIGGLTVAN